MVTIHQNTSFAFVVEIRAEIDPTYDMPASLKLFFETFFDVLCCILEVCDFRLYHLHVDVLGKLQCIVSHVHFHVAEFDLCGDLHIGADPVFGNACTAWLLLLTIPHFFFFLFACHAVALLCYVQIVDLKK